jgi:hypothetical protein
MAAELRLTRAAAAPSITLPLLTSAEAREKRRAYVNQPGCFREERQDYDRPPTARALEQAFLVVMA